MNEQLEKYLDDPNVQAFLGMLRDAEGTARTANAYKTRFGGAVDDALDYEKGPTFVKRSFTQTDGKKNKSGAVGAYQFIEKTWKGLAKNYGFKDFSPRTQDLAAIALLKENGALPYIMRGDFKAAEKRAGKTWASLPSSPYAQHKRSDEFVTASLARHLGTPAPTPSPAETQVAEAETPKKKPLATTASLSLGEKPKSLWSKLMSLISRRT